MMLTARRPTSRINIFNYNPLLYPDYDANINSTENYFLFQSPRPMTYRDLRTVVSNIKSSNLVILPESLKSSQELPRNSPIQNRRKNSSRKKQKHQGVNVYRSLSRADSRCSVLSERDITNDEIMFLSNSFLIDHGSPSATSGFFHPQNLPNLQKHRINNNNNNNRIENIQNKLRYTSSPSLLIQHVEHIRPTPVDIQCEYNNYNNNNGIRTSLRRTSSSLRMQHVGHTQPTPPQLVHRTSPVDVQYEDDNSEITPTTTISLSTSKTPTRRQLHVYMPQILSC